MKNEEDGSNGKINCVVNKKKKKEKKKNLY